MALRFKRKVVVCSEGFPLTSLTQDMPKNILYLLCLKPRAPTEVTALQTRKMVSKTQSVINNWLKALFIFGPHNTMMAKMFPMKPNPPTILETRPVRYHFQSCRICQDKKRNEKRGLCFRIA